MNKNTFSRIFLILLVIAALIACYFVFKPFLVEMLVAAILATLFYKPFLWLVKIFKGKRTLAAAVMSLLIVLVVIIPVANLLVFAAKESFDTYLKASENIDNVNWSTLISNSKLPSIKGLDWKSPGVYSFVVDVIQKSGNWTMSSAAELIKGTTSFVVSVMFIILTMFFFFIDGEKMLERLMILLPLPNKYGREIFKKFNDVSRSFIFATFLVSLAQGFLCWLGMFIISLPFLFNVPLPAVFFAMGTALLSLIPVFGPWLIWLSVAIYLFFTGHVGAAVFLTIWGATVISTVDNIIRPLILHKTAQVNPIFLLFSIFGGIMLFGLWGLIIGPLIVSVAITIFNIYELEYRDSLEQ